MFSKSSSPAAGAVLLPRVCSVAPRAEWGAARACTFLLREEGDVPVFVLRSQHEEYAFGTRGFVHLDGFSLVSKKVKVHYLAYATHPFADVELHVAGVVTADAELIFTAGPHTFRVEVVHRDLAPLTALYKSLLSLAVKQARSAALARLLPPGVGAPSGSVAAAPLQQALLRDAALLPSECAADGAPAVTYAGVFATYLDHGAVE
jgi:hypothetical protein